MSHSDETFYQTLELDSYASIDDVRAAYRRIVVHFHPDKNDAPDAVLMFSRINEAYKVLSDPTRKAVYDAALRRLPSSEVGDFWESAVTGPEATDGEHSATSIDRGFARDRDLDDRGLGSKVLTIAVLAVCLLIGAGLVAYLQLPWLLSVSSPKVGQTFSDCSGCPSMRVVPAGNCVMGAQMPEGQTAPEWALPTHAVTIAAPFAIGQFEITHQQFVLFLNESLGSLDPRWVATERTDTKSKVLPRLGKFVVLAGFESYPVTGVSWLGATAYAGWLSEKTGRKYRLPTEAEWEYAARAGATERFYAVESVTDLCRIGNVPDYSRLKIHSNWVVFRCDDGFPDFAPVGKFEPNAFGLHDVLGNAWEWVQDCWHNNYDGAPGDGSAWVTGGDCQRRVLRGNGHATFNGTGLASRAQELSVRTSEVNGFRIVRDVD